MAGATPLGNMVIKLGLDDADFGRGVANSKKQVTYLSKEMSANMKIADMTGNKLGKLGARYDGLTQIIKAQQKQVSALKKDYDESFVDGKATDSTKRLAAQLQDANGKLANYQIQLQNTSGQIARYKIETQGLTGWMKQHSDAYISQGEAIKKLGVNVSTFGTSMTRKVTTPILATTSAFGVSLVKMGLDVRKFRSQSQIFYEGLYQDSNKAIKQLDDLMSFAKTTPFQYESIVEADQIMQTFGVNTGRSKEILIALANTIAATGGSSADLSKLATIMGQIESSGKLSLEDMNQLVTAKIPAFKIVANELGVSVQDLRKSISKGEITSDQAINSLTKGLMQGTDGINGATQAYTGSLDKVKKTLPGAIDSMKSAWKNLALDLVDENGFDKVINSINRITQMVKSGAFTPVIKSASEVLGSFVDKVGDLAEEFAKMSPEQQQSILKWVAYAAAAGPAIKILGGGISVLGSARKGIGLLSNSIIELSAASSASSKKKAISYLTKSISGIGAASAASAGTSGVGALTSAIGVGSSSGLVAGLGALVGPAAIAVGVIGSVGFAAYKGTKAYEAHQLAGAKWGTEITKEQDKVITKSYELGNKAKADIAAYSDGVKGSANDVVKSNNDIVDSIQKAVEKESERRKKAAEKIEDPESRKKAEDYADYKVKLDQKTVDSAKETVGNINKIMAEASQNNRNLSTEEKNFIAENYRQLSDAQLKAAGFNKDQRIAIESAYQKDLAKLSDKQLQDRAENVMKGLDKEKTWYEKQKSYLKEVYGEGTESYKKEMTNLNENNHKNTETMILGLARLTKAQGFSLENMSGAWKKYGWTTQEVADLVKNSGEDSGKEAENLGNILKNLDRDWDSIKLDPKTGKLTVEGKEDLIQSLLETNKWKDLTLDEKKLLVNGDEARITFLDSATEAKKWEQYQILAKEISIENRSAIQAILDTQGGLDKWNALQPDEKELLAKNDGLLKNVLTSEESLNAWRALPVETKELLADSGNLYSVLSRSEEDLNKWKGIPDPVKKILGDNSNYIQVDSEAKAALSVWQNTPDPIKKILADNTNAMTAIVSSKENLDIWLRMPEETKKLLGDNQNFLASKEGATAELQKWANDNPAPKSLDAINNTATPVANAKATIVTLSGKTVTLDAENQTPIGVNAALIELDKLPKYRGISIGVERVGGGERLPPELFNAKGTNFHPGGDMIVNDQKGPLYKEIVHEPGKAPYIPFGRNVYIPNVKRGTKVYTASKTRQLMQRAGIPRYANGVGIPEDAQIIKNLRSVSDIQAQADIRLNVDNSNLEVKLDAMIGLFKDLLKKDPVLIMDDEIVSKKIEKKIARRNAN